MKISASEHGVIRIFALDLPADQAAKFDSAALKSALGADSFDADKAEIFDVADLDDLKLTGYLIQGNGVSETDVSPFAPQLSALKGHVAIVYSAAFKGSDQTLKITTPLRHIATFNEAPLQVKFKDLPSDSAARTPHTKPAKKPVSDAAMSGRVATVALLVIFAFTAVFIWAAG
jgi:hypothetical protein